MRGETSAIGVKTLIKKFFKKIGSGAVIGLGFILSIGIFFIVYAAGRSVMTPVTSGSLLSANSWNQMIDNLDDLNGRLLGITNIGGNFGIGVSPNTKLQVNGNTYTNQVCNQSGGNCIDFSKKIPGSVYFRAYQSTTQSIASAPNPRITIKHNIESIDNSNSYNPTTGIFTIPVSGFYHFDANLEIINTNADQIDIAIYSPQKGILCVEAQDAATITVGNDRLSCGGSNYFNAGDTVYVQGYQNTGVIKTTSGDDWTNFSGFLVSQ